MTYGFQPTKAKPGAAAAAFHTGYVDVFAAHLRKLSAGIQVVNYGCPGESTVTFSRGGCPAGSPGVCHSDHADGVGQRLASDLAGHVQGLCRVRPQARAGRDGVVRLTPGHDSRPSSSGRADGRDHRHRSVEPRSESSIVRAATASNARVARMLPVFNPPGSLHSRRARLCALTFICSKGDPHPTDAGYRAMAGAVAAAAR